MAGREPSMEDILASIKKVIAEEKELRTASQVASPPQRSPSVEPDPEPEQEPELEPDVLELEEPVVEEMALPPVDLGPPHPR
jgi:hypothetical protein